MTNAVRSTLIMVVFVFCIGVMGVAADPSQQMEDQPGWVTTNATYSDSTETPPADQRIWVEVTIAPEEEITDILITVDDAEATVLLVNSFSREVDVGSTDPDVTSRGDGGYQISNLRAGDEITVRFAVVPITLADDEVTAAEIRAEYVAHGQSVTETEQPTADLTSSPWDQYQASQEHVTNLKTEVEQQDQTYYGGFLIGGLGLVSLLGSVVYIRYRRRQWYTSVADELASLADQVSPKDRSIVEQKMDRLELRNHVQRRTSEDESLLSSATNTGGSPTTGQGDQESTQSDSDDILDNLS